MSIILSCSRPLQTAGSAATSFTRSNLKTSQRPPTEESDQESSDGETSEESNELEGQVSTPLRQRKVKLTNRAKMGCYSCGATRSSLFRRWQDSALAPKIQEIRAARPESEEICSACLMSIYRSAKFSEVRPSLANRTVANYG